MNLPLLISTLLPRLLLLLSSLQQDPEPVVSLIQKLLAPLSFNEALSYTSGPSALADALRSLAPSVNMLAVDVLRKALRSAGDTAMVAGMKDVVSELIDAYFLRDTQVSSAIGSLLEAFMEKDFSGGYEPGVDIDLIETIDDQLSGSRGHGLMWRRLFEDQNIYEKFFALTSLNPPGAAQQQISKRQRTVAQARLLAIIPPLATLDFETISKSHFPKIEESYGVSPTGAGLLEYAALHMVDTKDDVLMHMTLLDFFTSLLEVMPAKPTLLACRSASKPTPSHSSPALEFLHSKGIHDKALNYYVQSNLEHVDAVDLQFLFGRSANYLATYASKYPRHMLQAMTGPDESSLVDRVLFSISQALDASWTRRTREAPAHDLHVLVSLPRVALLPQIPNLSLSFPRDSRRKSPVFRLPAPPSHEDYLKTIATLFHGPEIRPGQDSDRITEKRTEDEAFYVDSTSEAAAARALYFLYLDQNPEFFTNTVKAAETIAVKENAIAAIGVISAVIKANWAPLPTSTSSVRPVRMRLPTEDELAEFLHSSPRSSSSQSQLPSSGIEALLTSPAVASVVPYLCSPPQTFSGLVGGMGDAESAAYKVAVAKFEALRALHDGLKAYPSKFGEIKALVANAAGRGPWGSGSGVGANIATMEL